MDVNKKLASLQEISKAQLSKILTINADPKYLVLENKLIKPLERVCGVKWLKGNGIEKIFRLEDAAPDFGTIQVFYMIFSTLPVFKKVVEQIRSKADLENLEKSASDKFHIIVVPRYYYIFEEELEHLGLLHSVVKLHSFIWLPLSLDVGLLSIEIPFIYNRLFLQQDTVCLSPLSRTLWQLFFVVGRPRLQLALGQFSNIMLQQIELFNEDRGETDKLDSDFGSVVIIDRNMDYQSALLTPGVYSALLSEVFQVNSGVCEMPEEPPPDPSTSEEPQVKKQPVKFNMDSSQDSVYADIKNRYFTEVTTVLSNLTKQLTVEKATSKEMALDEMKRYVQTQLQATKTRKKFITNHLLAAEVIINTLGHRYEKQQEVELDILRNSSKSANIAYLEENLPIENDKLLSLRLFCLLCATQKLSDGEIKSFWTMFLHQFGYEYGFAYRYLINGGFFSEEAPPAGSQLTSKIRNMSFSNTSSNFYTIAGKLKQIPPNPDKINLKFPTCSSYVFGGSYIPLIVQIASMLLNSTPLDTVKAKLEDLGQLTLINDRGFPLQPRSVLIYLIGGVTYAEIAACNLLETLTGSRIVVLSDHVISGNHLMRQILDTDL